MYKYIDRYQFLFFLILVCFTQDTYASQKGHEAYVPISLDGITFVVPYRTKGSNINLSGYDNIVSYSGGGNGRAPTLQDYMAAGLTKVRLSDVEMLNSRLKETSQSDVDTKAKLKKLVSILLGEISESKIVAYAKATEDVLPQLEDYRRSGIRCVTAENIGKVNMAMRNETFYDVKDRYYVQQTVYDAIGTKNIVLDNDAFDPDWVIMLSATMGLEQSCEIHTVGILTTGRDLNRKQSMAYSTILHYYGLAEIPIGLNLQQSMRTYYLDATSPNPKHRNYRGRYRNIDDFPSHHCLDYTICPGILESTGMMCTILQNIKGKVSWVIGGHMHNIANLLRETQRCNGKALVSQKVKQIVVTSGWQSRTSGAPEMNFSEGTTRRNSASDATKYLFANRPSNVPIIIASIPNADTGKSRVGDIFARDAFQDSPMAFILSVPRYGVYGDHGLSDTEALMYAVREGKTKYGTPYTVPVKTCFNIKSYGAVTIGNNCNREEYFLRPIHANYRQMLENEIWPLLEIKPKRQ